MKLYLLRHGETDWNVQWRLQGITDTMLNEKGVSQANEAAKRYESYPFQAVYCSPLQRARTTAEIIAKSHGLPVIVDERLIEMCFGDLEGTTPKDTEGDENRFNLFKHPELYVPDSNAESFESVFVRCADFVEDMKKSGLEHVLIVSHGGLCRGIEAVVHGREIKDFWGEGPAGNCEVIEIEV